MIISEHSSVDVIFYSIINHKETKLFLNVTYDSVTIRDGLLLCWLLFMYSFFLLDVYLC